jgi:hypothetical protein
MRESGIERQNKNKISGNQTYLTKKNQGDHTGYFDRAKIVW